jgi:hypothetical protein
MTQTRTFLHIGCGHRRQRDTTPGFNGPEWRELRFDIDPAVQPDVIGTMVDLSAIPEGSMDAIFSSHNLEHLYAHEVEVALSEFVRVLKPDGFLVVICPDLQRVCKLVAEDRLLEAAYVSPAGPISPIDMLYGLRASLRLGNHFMAHRCGFTPSVLIKVLQTAGFSTVAAQSFPESFNLWALASKAPLAKEQILYLARLHFGQ